jgi:hypothetical protein
MIYMLVLCILNVSCDPEEVQYNYEIKSTVPLEFRKDGMNYEVLKKEDKEHQPRKSAESKPTFERDRGSPPRRSNPPRRKSPSPPRRNNKLVDDDSSSIWRALSVFVPGSSANRSFCDLACDNSSLWDTD